jgi:RNA 2',3'-cyclic 3'-phosphodiesterase
MSVRSFLAFDVNDELREYFKHIIHDLQKACADVRWVKPENIHLTLKFLGDVQEGDLDKISSTVAGHCLNVAPVTSFFTGIGAFPDLRCPKIVWGGLDDDSRAITSLAGDLEKSLAGYGIPQEQRPFKPHVTIGRVRSQHNVRNLTDLIDEMSSDHIIEQKFTKMILYQSTLTTQGPLYEVLREFDMKGKGRSV